MCLPISCILIIPQNRIANILTSPCALRRAVFTNKQSCMLPKLSSFRLQPRFVKSYCQYVVNEGMLLLCPQRGIWSNRRKCKRSSPSYSPLHPRDGSFLFLAGSCPCWGSSCTGRRNVICHVQNMQSKTNERTLVSDLNEQRSSSSYLLWV